METGFSLNENPPNDDTTKNETVKLRRSNRLIEKRRLALSECRTINLLDDANDIGTIEQIDFPQEDLHEFDIQFGENPPNEESNPSMNNLLVSNSYLELDKSIAYEHDNEFPCLMPEPINVKEEPKELYFGGDFRNLSSVEIKEMDEKMECLSTSKLPCSDLNVPTFPQAVIIQDPPPVRLNLNPNDANNLGGPLINQQSTSKVQCLVCTEELTKKQTVPIKKQTKLKPNQTGLRKKRNSRKPIRKSKRGKKSVGKIRRTRGTAAEVKQPVRKDRTFESNAYMTRQLKHLVEYEMSERSSDRRHDWEAEPKSWHLMMKTRMCPLKEWVFDEYCRNSDNQDLNDYLDNQCEYCECEILKSVGEGNVSNMKRKRLN